MNVIQSENGENDEEYSENPEQNVVHQFIIWVVDVEPTCCTDGIKSLHCAVKGCNEKINETTIPATGKHVYTSWKISVPAKCNKPGIKVRYCKGCNKKQEQTIPKTGYVKNGIFNKKNNSFRILSVNGKRGKVAWIGQVKPKNSTSIPEKVKVKGITFTVLEIGKKAYKKLFKKKTGFKKGMIIK